MTPLFAASIFASAFLLFLVQPMVGKRIVPWFGGTPAVWTLCLAFYQTALFLGYAYAHALIAWVPARRQALVHAALFAAALAVLPVLPGDVWKPGGAVAPNAHILAMLAANVALPFVALAATGPLLQAWFARAASDRSPYPLYALSNVGSLLALMAFPFVFEPRLPLSYNATLWSAGFALTGAGVIACAWLAARARPGPARNDPAPARASAPRRVALWFALPACAVVIFMGISNELCLDVASVPFLWVVPLGIYLSTFIVCFASERFYRRGPFTAAAVALAAVLALASDGSPALIPRSGISVYTQITAYGALLFVCCTLLHGELYRLRPAPSALTGYYLWISAGGAVGGGFVGLVAPRIFDDYDELWIGLLAGALLVAAAWGLDATSTPHRGRWRAARLAALAACLGALAYAVVPRATGQQIAMQERNFYGVLRVSRDMGGLPPRVRIALSNGTTSHGYQLAAAALRALPTTYYTEISGIGIALSEPSERSRNVGLIGLGIGTLAAYGRPGDHFRFYEVDADVARIARDAGYFSFLSGSAAGTGIVVGDARLSLEAELRDGSSEPFDVLVLDAFSSDSIPVHLMTREAFGLYRKRLREGGLLAVHVSSLHLKLDALVHRLATDAGLHAISVTNLQNHRFHAYRSTWVLIHRDPEALAELERAAARTRTRLQIAESALQVYTPAPAELARAPLWTDDYSDLFRVVLQKPH